MKKKGVPKNSPKKSNVGDIPTFDLGVFSQDSPKK